jgi:hypothetical protein
MLPSTQVIMTQCILYAECHEKVVKSFKMKPHVVAFIWKCVQRELRK